MLFIQWIFSDVKFKYNYDVDDDEFILLGGLKDMLEISPYMCL